MWVRAAMSKWRKAEGIITVNSGRGRKMFGLAFTYQRKLESISIFCKVKLSSSNISCMLYLYMFVRGIYLRSTMRITNLNLI